MFIVFLEDVLVAVAVTTLVAKAPEATAQMRLAAADTGSLSTSESGWQREGWSQRRRPSPDGMSSKKRRVPSCGGGPPSDSTAPRGQGAEQDIWRWRFPWRNDGLCDCPCHSGRGTLLVS